MISKMLLAPYRFIYDAILALDCLAGTVVFEQNGHLSIAFTLAASFGRDVIGIFFVFAGSGSNFIAVGDGTSPPL